MVKFASVQLGLLLLLYLLASYRLVESIASDCNMNGRHSLFLDTNALLCRDRYNWSLSELIKNPEQIKYIVHLIIGILIVYLTLRQ